jgi:addiction module RelE/StbE family toxin
VKLVWSESALHQFTQLFEYIAAQNPDAAERIADQIDEAALSLLDFPEMGSPGLRAGTRKRVVTGTRYLLTYAIRGENIVILNVWHGRQDWKR